MKEVKPSVRRPRAAAAKTVTAPPKKPAPRAKAAAVAPDPVRHVMIATAAYYRAEKRGFRPGHELEDWFAAEAELATQVTQATPATAAPARKPAVRARKTTG